MTQKEDFKKLYDWLRKNADVNFVGKSIIQGKICGYFFYVENVIKVFNAGRFYAFNNLDALKKWHEAEVVLEHIIRWRAYNKENKATFPTIAKKYWVIRKNKSMEKCMWNGTGWAYNNNDILYYSYYDPISLLPKLDLDI